MTEATSTTTYASPRLERPPGGKLGGVSLALARTTGTGHVMWRVLFVVLTPFGGLGAALYLVGWVGIPKEGEAQSLAERLLHGPDRRVTTKQVLLVALAALAVAGALQDGALTVLVVAALGYAVWRRRGTGAPPAAAGASLLTAPGLAAPVPSAEVVPAPPRERSVVTALTLSAAALVVGLLLLLAGADVASIPAETVLASALGVVGLGLLASAVWGRGRGLLPVAILVGLALGATAGARPAIEHGVGERSWLAQRSGSFELGVGEATLEVSPRVGQVGGVEQVSAKVRFGHLVVVVPEGVTAVVQAHVHMGEIDYAPQEDVDNGGRDIRRTIRVGSGDPQVTIEADVYAGVVEVRSA